MGDEPELNTSYALELGSSLTRRSNTDVFCAWRYDFKPASLGTQGVFRQSGHKASLLLPSSSAQFSGKVEPCKGDLECVAIFDGTSWRLELLSSTIITKFGRTAAGVTTAALASTPDLPSTNTSWPSSDHPGGSGSDPFASDDEVQGSAPPRAAAQQVVPSASSKPHAKPPNGSQLRPSLSPSPAPQASTKSTLGKRPAATAPAQPSQPKAPKAAKADTPPTVDAVQPGRKGQQAGGVSAPSRPVVPELAAPVQHAEELDWDAAFEEDPWEQEIGDLGTDASAAAPTPPPPQPLAPPPQPPQQTARAVPEAPKPQAKPPAPSAAVPAARNTPPAPAPQAAKPPAPVAKAAAPAPTPAPVVSRPAVQSQPAPARKPSAPKPPKAPVDEWGFEGMDDEDDDEEEEYEEEEEEEAAPAAHPAGRQSTAVAPATAVQQQHADGDDDDDDWEDVDAADTGRGGRGLGGPAQHQSRPAAAAGPPRHTHGAPVGRAQGTVAAPVRPSSQPQVVYHDDDDDDDDDAHLRCSDDEASDGLGLEDGLC